MTKHEALQKLAEAQAEIARLRASERPRAADPMRVVAQLRTMVEPEQETFVVVMLDARQKILSTRVVGIGSVAHVDVHPREVFRDAVRMAAHSIIVAHNHPSGNPGPSEADIDLTKRLAESGSILGIPLVDHLIITDSHYCSMAAQGLVPAP